MLNRIHSYNNYLNHGIYFVLCLSVESMTMLSWQLCKKACSQVGFACIQLFETVAHRSINPNTCTNGHVIPIIYRPAF